MNRYCRLCMEPVDPKAPGVYDCGDGLYHPQCIILREEIGKHYTPIDTAEDTPENPQPEST